jgi:hypothetical protein
MPVIEHQQQINLMLKLDIRWQAALPKGLALYALSCKHTCGLCGSRKRDRQKPVSFALDKLMF